MIFYKAINFQRHQPITELTYDLERTSITSQYIFTTTALWKTHTKPAPILDTIIVMSHRLLVCDSLTVLCCRLLAVVDSLTHKRCLLEFLCWWLAHGVDKVSRLRWRPWELRTHRRTHFHWTCCKDWLSTCPLSQQWQQQYLVLSVNNNWISSSLVMTSSPEFTNDIIAASNNWLFNRMWEIT